jgi:tubulin polyglutamylase TTLL4
MHLTNYSINKNNTEYQANKGTQEDVNESYSKWNFRTLRTAFEELGLNYDVSFLRINDVIIKTLISVEG